jgi:hypothetical protein
MQTSAAFCAVLIGARLSAFVVSRLDSIGREWAPFRSWR